MNFGNIFGQWFRDATGMPSKASTYDVRLSPYRDIVECITELKENVIKYFDEVHNSAWGVIQAQKMLLEGQLINGIISPADYDRQMSIIHIEEEKTIAKFIETSDEYFVVGYKRRLTTIKNRHKRDQYIGSMDFDSWSGMTSALEVARTVVAIVENDADYIDSKRVAAISDKFKYERHIRRGR